MIVVAGPSGSGKSQLCQRLHADFGLPIVNLDNFYKDGDNPSLPRTQLPAGGSMVDWDDPASWHAEEAVDALSRLCDEGSVEVPVYDLAHDGRTGRRMITLGDAAYVVAEGIFSDEIVMPCRERRLLGDAVCLHNGRVVTFWRRLTRDLRESRKPPWVLVRRGISLLRREPALLARAEAAGCVLVDGAEAYARLSRLVAD